MLKFYYSLGEEIISLKVESRWGSGFYKKLNSDYRAKDAKAYYNHLFDAKVEQYGKLQRAKKTK